MVLVCCWQVITRYALGDPSKVTEEFLRYSLIWLTMLGCPYAYGLNKHLAINFIVKNYTKNEQSYFNIFVESMVLLFSISVLIGGGILVCINSLGQTSPALHMPTVFLYLCLPINGVLMVYYSILKLKDNLGKMKSEKLRKISL
ncbi:TRAP transporter small permease [Clostridium lacusfryxellense]|nr:TRAP transporter small permease [Clostridium lacusfryxellense]